VVGPVQNRRGKGWDIYAKTLQNLSKFDLRNVQLFSMMMNRISLWCLAEMVKVPERICPNGVRSILGRLV
jgi:hypothetical protein